MQMNDGALLELQTTEQYADQKLKFHKELRSADLWADELPPPFYNRDLHRQKNHIIYFTPRSGSSWLTQELSATNRLGRAGEFLNPSFVKAIAESLKLKHHTLEAYLRRLIAKSRTGNNLFTIECTIYHIHELGADLSTFHQYINPHQASVLNIRKNIIAQGISLYKATQTNIFHTAGKTEKEISESKNFSDFNKQKILHWIRHILDQERKLAAYFREHAIRPKLMFYEDHYLEGARTLEVIAEHLNVRLDDDNGRRNPAHTNGHHRLAGNSNRVLEQQVRNTCASEVAKIEKQRSPILEYFSSISP